MIDYAATGINHLRLRAAANSDVDTRLITVSMYLYGMRKKMITLEIDNSYSQILGLDPADTEKLRKELSYQPPYNVSSKFARVPARRSLVGKRGDFPTGLLHRVVAYLQTNSLLFSTRDLRVKPTPQKGMFNLSTLPSPSKTPDRSKKRAL